MLDLNMPISDGYQTCKNITQKYDDGKIFKMVEEEKSCVNKIISKSIKCGKIKQLIDIKETSHKNIN